MFLEEIKSPWLPTWEIVLPAGRVLLVPLVWEQCPLLIPQLPPWWVMGAAQGHPPRFRGAQARPYPMVSHLLRGFSTVTAHLDQRLGPRQTL